MAWNTRLALVAMAVAIPLTGCAEEPAQMAAEPTDTPTTQAPADPTTTATPTTPTTPAASETPTPTPSVDPSAPRLLADRLLPAEDLPGFNEIFTWEVGVTSPGEPTESTRCQPFSILSIGAVKAAHRTYVPADGSSSSALEIVADFPDPMTAKRGYSVLQSWYADCAKRNDTVGLFTPVPLPHSGSAGWFLITEDSTFDAHGFVRRGSRIAVVQLTLRDAQDYNYESGQEPMVAALQRAATLL